jgi:Peptidase family M28
MRPPLALLVLLSACASSRPGPTPPTTGPDVIAPGATVAASGIRPEAIAAHIRFLADDLLEGRGTGDPGHRIAAAYVASELQGSGLEPGGEGGSWFQELTLRAGRLRSATLEVGTPSGGATTLQPGRDFVGHAPLLRGMGEASGPLVFVGYGVVAPEFHWDDFAGVDVRGKLALVLAGAPLTDRPDFFPPVPSAVYGSVRRKLETLLARGAAGVLFLQTPRRERVAPWERVLAGAEMESMDLVENGQVPPRTGLPQALLSMAGADALLAAAGRNERLGGLIEAAESGRGQSFELGVQAHLRTEAALRTVKSANVVGLWRAAAGSPAAGEYVVYTAHLDHLGIAKPEGGDAIYNGASDNAAGVAAVLEVARAFTRLSAHPRRGVLFVLVTGEEKGLLGSEWFAEHPTVPRASLVADVNADSGLALFPLKEVVALGAEESTLREDAQRAASALGLAVGKDDEPWQARAVRSDQYSFLRAGIPATATGVGLGSATEAQRAAVLEFRRTRYHRPADAYEPHRDYGPAAQLARFQFLLGLSIAQRAEAPTFLPGSFFLGGRER